MKPYWKFTPTKMTSLVLSWRKCQPFAVERDHGMLVVRFGFGLFMWLGKARAV